MMPYVCIDEDVEHEIIVKKSQFICALKIAEDLETAVQVVADIKKKHYNAAHNCSAMLIGQDFARCSDDGEPQGTAGVPMLEVLKHSGLTNIVAVVTRYFGGILLGTGGLARAYSKSVGEALLLAKKVEYMPADIFEFDIEYADYGKLQSIAGEFGAGVHANFLQKVAASVIIKKENSASFMKKSKDAFLGAEVCKITGECTIKKMV
ncbi:MAG: YigZ family protein [Christensenellaceae bacterium]